MKTITVFAGGYVAAIMLFAIPLVSSAQVSPYAMPSGYAQYPYVPYGFIDSSVYAMPRISSFTSFTRALYGTPYLFSYTPTYTYMPPTSTLPVLGTTTQPAMCYTPQEQASYACWWHYHYWWGGDWR